MTQTTTPQTTAQTSADRRPASGHLLGSADRPVVLVERELAATPAEVWDAWTDPARLVRWLGAVSGSLAVPGPVRVAMMATELPAEDATDVEGLGVFTVTKALPPLRDQPGRLVFGFHDAADPGGVVTVTLTPVGEDRCRIALEHVLTAVGAAEATGFGAGWEGFLDWLEDVLADRPHPDDDPSGTGRHEALLPHFEAGLARLRRVVTGTVTPAEGTGGEVVVRHERVVSAAPQAVWDLLTSADGLVGWLGELAVGTFGPGATVELVHDGTDPDGSRQVSEVTAWEPPHRLALTWTYPGEPTSALEVRLEPVDDAVRLVLEHRGLPAGLGQDYLTGWHAHLDLLVALAEGATPPPFAAAHRAAAHALAG